MKYIILGDGYIGNYLLKRLPNAEMYPSKIETVETIKLLMSARPDAILINCAGKTGKPNVDWCEDNKEITAQANVMLPIYISEAMKELGYKYWIHIGSGCLYNGYGKIYSETDPPDFYGSFYSRTKIYSQEILSKHHNVCVLRIRMPIDEALHRRSYVSKVVMYAKNDYPLFSLPNSMTALEDLARVIEFVSADRITGTFNTVNEGTATIEQILAWYKQFKEPELEFRLVDIDSVLSTLKAGRSNCVLSTEKLKKFGYTMPKIEDRIISYLAKKGHKR